jgi:Spy/CpxP family protein refolding chaperone
MEAASHLAWAVAALLLVPGAAGAAARAGGDDGICDRAQPTPQRGGPPPAGNRGDKPGEPQKGHSGPPKWWIDAKLRAELAVTDQQSAAVDLVWKKSMPALVEGRERLEKLEDALSEMTQRDGSDEAAVIAQIDRVENLRAELAKGRTLMIYRMNKLLTVDQRAKVKAMYEQRRDPSRRGSNPR